jgi:hypothetical protein
MCKVREDLIRFHDLVHHCADFLSEDEHKQAQEAGERIVNMLNDTCPHHGAKVLALMAAIGTGLDAIDESIKQEQQPGAIGHA